MRKDNDRERILCNIAAQLAYELSKLQSHPIVQEHFRRFPDYPGILCHREVYREKPFKKGELAVASGSSLYQQNPWLIAFVEGPHKGGDPNGLSVRAIGTDQICNYGNESFIRITGIDEKFLWEGPKREFAVKLQKTMKQMDCFLHRFRGLTFPLDGVADVYIGEYHGGTLRTKNGSKPYVIHVKYNKKTTLKSIRSQMEEQGFGKREFEDDDGKDDGAPFGNPKAITRADLVGSLSAAGIELKPEMRKSYLATPGSEGC
jgi:hypothetical protein